MISWAPVYHFVIYPFLYNREPSMLKRIGFGILLITLSHLLNAIFELTATYIPSQWRLHCHQSLLVLAPLLFGCGGIIAAPTAVEFCMAQAPCHIRGLISIVLTLSLGTSAWLNGLLHHNLKHTLSIKIVPCLVMTALFATFLFLSKRYKLRKRDEVIPYHMFAEDQFESNYEQDRDWCKDRGYSEWLFGNLKKSKRDE